MTLQDLQKSCKRAIFENSCKIRFAKKLEILNLVSHFLVGIVTTYVS